MSLLATRLPPRRLCRKCWRFESEHLAIGNGRGGTRPACPKDQPWGSSTQTVEEAYRIMRELNPQRFEEMT